MDWSLLALLFATGFALVGLTFLVIVVYKVFLKPPPTNNFANAPPPVPQAYQPLQLYTDPGHIQKLVLEQGNALGGRSLLPSIYGEQRQEMIPNGIPTVPPAEHPAFSPEPPVHQAVRVTSAYPIPDSIAKPAADNPLAAARADPGFIPDSEPTPSAQSKHVPSSIPPKLTSVPVSKSDVAPNLVFKPEQHQKEWKTVRVPDLEPAYSPAPVPESEEEPAVTPHFTPEPICAHTQEPLREAEPDSLSDPLPDESPPESPASDLPQVEVPTDTDNPESSSNSKDCSRRKSKLKRFWKREKEPEPALSEAADSEKHKKLKKLLEKLSNSLQNISLPVMCGVLATVCLLSIALLVYLIKPSETLQDEPVIIDIPAEGLEGVSDEEVPGNTPLKPVSYKMALIGEQEAVSSTESGFEASFPEGDYTNSTFYALSFVIQLDSAPGTEYQEIKVLDAATSEDLTATYTTVLHAYHSEFPSESYIASHPVKSAPVISSAVSDEIITCVFVSLEKKTMDDLKVVLVREDNAADGGAEVTINSQIEDISINPVYTMGNSLLKLGDQYYISESETGIGAIPDENKYVTRKIRCVSLPLTGSAPGLDSSYTALFDKVTGEKTVLPEGTEVYYKEDYTESQSLMSIEFGIKMSGGSYEEAALFMDAVLPGYDIDGTPLMF